MESWDVTSPRSTRAQNAHASQTTSRPPTRPDSTTATDDGDPAQRGWGILNWPSYGTLLAVVFLDTMIQTAAMVFIAFLMLAKGLPLVVATVIAA